MYCNVLYCTYDRQGFTIDRDVMRRLLNMMLSVGLYAEKFEEHFIADSRRFFLAEGQVKNIL